jgi:hypothetical protein
MFLPTKRFLTAIVVFTSLVVLASAFSGEDPFAAKRHRMVKQDVRDRGVNSAAVLDAMMKVPRHLFADEKVRNEVYADHPRAIEKILIRASSWERQEREDRKIRSSRQRCGSEGSVMS